MGKTIEERLENLERHLNTLTEKVRDIESIIISIQNNTNANSPYSGNAFQSPYGNPFRYSVAPQECDKHTNDIQSSSIIIQKLDELLNQFNNNFSRLNWRLEALENQRKE